MDHDKKFFDTFILILGALGAFTVAMYFLAHYLSGNYVGNPAQDEAIAVAQVNDRLSAPGAVRLPGDPEVSGSTVVATTNPSPAPQASSGQSVYDGACAVCHKMGIAGAPKFGEAAAWKDRIAQGMESLTEHAVNGFQGAAGVMPPKGGRADLSDADVRAAVEYMVENSQ